HLGLPLDLSGAGVARCVQEAGIGFCFAAAFHPGMRHAAVPRRELGVPTFFNFLGPLTNPPQPRSGVVGCAELRMAPVLANAAAAVAAEAGFGTDVPGALKAGLDRAAQSIDSGAAAAALDRWISLAQAIRVEQ